MKQGAVLKSDKEKKRTHFDLESAPEVFGGPDLERDLKQPEEFKKEEDPKAAWPGHKKGKTGQTPEKNVEMKVNLNPGFKI